MVGVFHYLHSYSILFFFVACVSCLEAELSCPSVVLACFLADFFPFLGIHSLLWPLWEVAARPVKNARKTLVKKRGKILPERRGPRIIKARQVLDLNVAVARPECCKDTYNRLKRLYHIAVSTERGQLS